MITKKMLLSLFMIVGSCAAIQDVFAETLTQEQEKMQAHEAKPSLKEIGKKLYLGKPLSEQDYQMLLNRKQETKDVFVKWAMQEELSIEEQEIVSQLKYIAGGTATGLTVVYLIPPVGLGVLGQAIAKLGLGAAGGYGLVKIHQNTDIEQVKARTSEIKATALEYKEKAVDFWQEIKRKLQEKEQQ